MASKGEDTPKKPDEVSFNYKNQQQQNDKLSDMVQRVLDIQCNDTTPHQKPFYKRWKK